MITSLNGRNRSTRLKQNDAGFRHICMGRFPLFTAVNTKQKAIGIIKLFIFIFF